MATADIRKVIRIGGSLAIILPCQWTKGKVRAGDEMVVIGNGDLHVFPLQRAGPYPQHEDGNGQKSR